MHIIVVSLNYRTAPIEVRERLSFSDDHVAEAMTALNKEKSILENIIVSTCNRTELYVVADQAHTGRYYTKRFISEWFSFPLEEINDYVSIKEDKEAIEHLFRLSAGLDSMVLGETQILGQVKTAFDIAQKHDASGLIFNQLFKMAVTNAKRAHHETEIGEHAVSISYAAVELSKKLFRQINDKHALIVGAGEMGELAAQNLHGSGVKNITIANRTLKTADTVAQKVSGKAKSIEQLSDALVEADIVIGSTGANDYVITKEIVSEAFAKRDNRPLVLIDISVPRNIDPNISELENVMLYDIDDLQDIVDHNLEERQKAAEQIEKLIVEEIKEFDDWLVTLGVVPILSALRKKALKIQAETMASIERKMPDLTDRERKVLSKHTKSIINQMLKEPILQAKEMAGEEHSEDMLKLFIRVFGIEEEVQHELEEQSKKHQSHQSVTRMLPIASLFYSNS